MAHSFLSRRPGRRRARRRFRPELSTLEDREVMAVNPLDPFGPAVAVAANPTILWPPNGKLQTVTVYGFTADNPGGTGVNPATLSYAVIDEYHQVPLQLTHISDVVPIMFGTTPGYAFAFQVQLPSSRFGNDFDGRQFAILVGDLDNAGNLGLGGTVVTVPHDMGHAPVFGLPSPGVGGGDNQGGNDQGDDSGGVVISPAGGGGQGNHGNHGNHGNNGNHGHGKGKGHGHGH